LAALVRTGRATAQDLRELIEVPNDLETVLQRFDEATGLRESNLGLAEKSAGGIRAHCGVILLR
jgi:hypothetical protein